MDVETLCHCILEFADVATVGHLNLTSVPLCYDKTHWNEEMYWMEAPYEANFPEEEYYDD